MLLFCEDGCDKLVAWARGRIRVYHIRGGLTSSLALAAAGLDNGTPNSASAGIRAAIASNDPARDCFSAAIKIVSGRSDGSAAGLRERLEVYFICYGRSLTLNRNSPGVADCLELFSTCFYSGMAACSPLDLLSNTEYSLLCDGLGRDGLTHRW